jgi:DNA-nicking Smr family endonuclease
MNDRKTPAKATDPSDRELWHHVTRETRPLKGRDALHPEVETPAPEAKSVTRPSAQAKPAAARVKPAPPPPAAKTLGHGTIADVDRRSAERLKRGQLAIEATLDLHGMTQAAAHQALDGFLAESQARGRRCVLVVTGKGLTRDDAGVLRRQVPLWLNQAPNRARLLAFDYAQPRHGGQGALYLLLKRRRDGR